MAERTMKDLTAPVLAKTRNVGDLVVHAGSENQRPGTDLRVARADDEPVSVGARVGDLGVLEDDRVIGRDLLSGASVELAGRCPI